MARPARIPTQDELDAIVELKSKNVSDEKVAKALSISRSTLLRWKRGIVGGKEDDTIKVQLEQSYKKGKEERLERHLELAVDAIDILLTKHTYEEVTRIDKTYMGVDSTETKRVTKTHFPNATVAIFTVVNRDPENFRSINNQIDTTRDEMPKGVDIVLEDAPEKDIDLG